jgi:hypothetical protein
VRSLSNSHCGQLKRQFSKKPRWRRSKHIGPKIDVDFCLDHLMENFLNQATRSALHSYAHSGLLQLTRRFDGNEVKPSYGEGETIEA